MAQPIIFTITEASKQAALNANADSAQLKINLTQVAVGTGKHLPTGLETALTSEVKRSGVVSGDIEVNSNTLRFTSSMSGDTKTDVYEVGLFTDDGVLFALAGSNTTPLFILQPDITFVVGFGLSLQDVAAGSVTVSIDTNNSLAPVLMQNHVAAANPHPQYVALSRFQFLLEVMFPVGYLHHTNSASNPKPEFDQLLGIDTAWRRLAGKIIVGTDPNDDYIKDVGLVLGQKGMTEPAGTNERPNTYPLYTKNIFERYNPDDVVETVWNVSANKTSITEGDAVRFTVTANNIPDGQILNWTVKEGELNSGSNDITAPDKSQSGTVILKNGSALIDFTTTPDDNAEEPQKHVRLTVGAPASLSINVPINDLGNTESIVHITQSTTNGIQLDEYYKQQSGAYPTATDKVRFIVDAGVDIIAPDTDTPALIEGANWPAGSQIVVENHGRILGRGGDGGRSARVTNYFESSGSYTRVDSAQDFTAAEKGRNGGTAVQGRIEVDNYGLIAGGGGGGGGLGAYDGGTASDSGSARFILSGGGAGGGAPLGRASFNEGTIKRYLSTDEYDKKVSVLNNNENLMTLNIKPITAGGVTSRIVRDGGGGTSTGTSYSDEFAAQDLSLSGSYFKTFSTPLMAKQTNDYSLDVQKTLDGVYKLTNSNYRDYHTVAIGVDSDLVRRMSTNATVEACGLGGCHFTGCGNSIYFNHYLLTDSASGGNGGDIGVAGSAGVFNSYFIYVGTDNGRSPVATDQSSLVWYVPSAQGGLAGFVKEGDVTITNYSAGTTKGR